MIKSLVVVNIVSLMFETACSQQVSWQTLKAPTTWSDGRYDDLYFVTPQLGWAVHAYVVPVFPIPADSIKEFSKIYKTTDGGQTWIVVKDSIKTYLRSVHFIDSLTGWVGTLGDGLTYDSLGFDSTLLFETTDGGVTWSSADSKISGPKPRGLCGMWSSDSDNVYICGKFNGPAYILKTTDRGARWQSIDMNSYAGRLIDIYFWSRDSGIVVGGTTREENSSAIVLFTSDGGSSWSERYRSTDSDGWCWKISFPSRRTGFVSLETEHGHSTYFLKTTDGGASWTRLTIGAKNYDLEGIGFITDNIGWAGGWGLPLSRSTDGGGSWTIGNQPFRVNRFRFFGDTLGYAAGSSLYKIQLDWSHSSVYPETTSIGTLIYPNPFSTSTTIHFTVGHPSIGSLSVYDLLGRRVMNSIPQSFSIGREALTIDGHALPAGTYWYQLKIDDHLVSGLLERIP